MEFKNLLDRPRNYRPKSKTGGIRRWTLNPGKESNRLYFSKGKFKALNPGITSGKIGPRI